MAQNVSYATTDTILESLVLHILPYIGDEGDGILNTNGLTAALNAKGAKEVIDGGLEVWFGLDYSENSNFKFQGKNDDMTANAQDPQVRLRFDWKAFTGSVVINDLDKAMNKGRAAIKQWAKTLRRQATKTIANQFNSAWWKATPGANDPQSIPSLIPITYNAGTVGGLSRAGNAYLQNGYYSTAISDIGSESGISKIEELKIRYSVGTSLADLLIVDQTRFGNMAGYLSTLYRFRPDDKLRVLKIPSIMIGDATMIFENTNVLGGANSITAGYMYGINTDYLWIKTLRDGNSVWSTEFERIGQKLNKAVFFKWFGNLVTNCPRAHWVASSLT